MAPAAKKRKVNQQKFLCFSCATERISSQFPEYNPSSDCEHLINNCKTCLKKWVEAQVDAGNLVKKGTSDGGDSKENKESKAVKNEGAKVVKEEEGEKAVNQVGKEELLFGVRCPHPDCKGVMRNANVQDAATKKVYARFEELERKFIGDYTPSWRWCLAADCRAGQVHISQANIKPDKPAELPKKQQKRGKKANTIFNVFADRTADDQIPSDPRAEADIFTCNTCRAEACVACDRPWHEGETCAEFHLRTKDRIEEEDKALRAIQKVTKACPGCSKRIEKNGGCPFMNCSQCSATFCWNCASRYTGDRSYCQCAHNRAPATTVGML